MWEMSRQEFKKLLKVASEQVDFGIYALSKNNFAELRCDKCSSKSQLHKVIKAFKSQGFKVYYNGI